MSPVFSSVKSVLLIRQKIGLKYSYANFLCMKQFSINVNLALLSMQVVRNASFPPRKQMAPQWHKWKWRKKKKSQENKTEFGRKLVIQWQAESTGKQKDARACCLMLSHGKAPNLCCIAAPELRLQKSSLQMLAHTSCISSATSNTSFITHLICLCFRASGSPGRDHRTSALTQE